MFLADCTRLGLTMRIHLDRRPKRPRTSACLPPLPKLKTRYSKIHPANPNPNTNSHSSTVAPTLSSWRSWCRRVGRWLSQVDCQHPRLWQYWFGLLSFLWQRFVRRQYPSFDRQLLLIVVEVGCRIFERRFHHQKEGLGRWFRRQIPDCSFGKTF